jgi:hypothetical protein
LRKLFAPKLSPLPDQFCKTLFKFFVHAHSVKLFDLGQNFYASQNFARVLLIFGKIMVTCMQSFVHAKTSGSTNFNRGLRSQKIFLAQKLHSLSDSANKTFATLRKFQNLYLLSESSTFTNCRISEKKLFGKLVSFRRWAPFDRVRFCALLKWRYFWGN